MTRHTRRHLFGAIGAKRIDLAVVYLVSGTYSYSYLDGRLRCSWRLGCLSAACLQRESTFKAQALIFHATCSVRIVYVPPVYDDAPAAIFMPVLCK